MKNFEIKKMSELLQPFFKTKAHIKKVVLFGSSVRDSEAKRSDIDLMVIMDTDKRFFKRYADLEDIYRLFPGKSIDLLIYTPEELNRITHRRFIKKIVEEGQTIYEH